MPTPSKSSLAAAPEKQDGSLDLPKTPPSAWPKTLRRRFLLLLGAVTLSALFFLSPHQAEDAPGTYALCSRDGAYIYTVDEKNSRKQCVVIHKGYIVDAGDIEDVEGRWTESASLPVRYTPPGSIVVPGISDSHVHMLEYGASKLIPLEDGKSIPEVVASVREYILSNPDIYNDKTKIVEGWGWDHTIWPTEGWPHSNDLDNDAVTKDRPIILQSKDGHAIWVSPTTLKANSPIPESIEGGIIVKDADGNPTGVFLDNAQSLIAKPEMSEDDLRKRFEVTVRDALANGLTSVHDAGFSPDSLTFFRKQADKGDLPLRIYGMTYFDENGDYWGNVSQKLVDHGNGRLSARSVKLYADGALRTGGAALYEPYEDNPSTSGFMRLSPEVMDTIIPKFLKDGWQVNVHAIGDRSNGLVLDAFEKAVRDHHVDLSQLRPRLEHAQIMTPKDMKRLGQLGVIASVQPTHVIDDMWYAEDRLGPERIKNLYAFRSILNSSARITLGSDFPVESINPLKGFYAAITRVTEDGRSPHGSEGWFPEQRLTRVEALRGMTIDPAYASFSESSLGSLEPGKRADFVVLSRDIMSIPVQEIMGTTVLATVLDGKAVYGGI